MPERSLQDRPAPPPDVGAPARPADEAAALPEGDRPSGAAAGLRSASVTILAVLALLYTLYFARDFLLPVAFATLLNFLFSPLVRVMAGVRIRPPLGAAIVLLGGLALGGVAIYELSDPIQSWATRVPETVRTTQARLEDYLGPLRRITDTAGQVGGVADSAAAPPQRVVIQGPSIVSRIFGTTQRLFAFVVQVAILLYFLLAVGDLFLQKLIKVLPTVRDKKKAFELARATESSISSYLLTASLINFIEGVVVAVAMYLLGMPNPALWGALAFVLEFIPFLGAIVTAGVIGLAALTTFPALGQALLAPAVFLVINFIHGNFVVPMFLGSRLALNPVALFLGLSFWFWIWGIPGAFIAVPLMATFKIFCDHIESLAPVGEFLGPRDQTERRAIVRDR